ncbi:MAG: hypothetical protein JSV86_10460 [Gemmatimonadota bacterium]|nr:MAG: hypothetical protein JSV86_10460 [Gemmatimonadota bacterium]
MALPGVPRADAADAADPLDPRLFARRPLTPEVISLSIGIAALLLFFYVLWGDR